MYMVVIVVIIMMMYMMGIFLQWLSMLHPDTKFGKWWKKNICDVDPND